MFASLFSHTQQMTDRWAETARGQLDKLDGWAEDLTRVRAESLTRAETAIDEAAKVAKETLVRANEVPAEWRKLWVETVRELLAVGTKAS